jgi:uncharacterized protein (TIGR00725 family)
LNEAAPRRYAAVVGPSRPDEAIAALAEEVGRGLAAEGFTVVTGGLGGAMEAASRGAHEQGGTVVGVLPDEDRSRANAYADVTVATGVGNTRNLSVVASADVVVAVGGEWGTLSEIAMAGVLRRPVISLQGWRLEHSGGLPGEVHYADGAAEAVQLAVQLAR